MKAYEDRPYRPCVGICLVNDEGLIFAGKRIDNRSEAWQMPQGGIDEGEDALTACFREMAEEIGTDKAELITQHPEWLDYDIPEALANKLWNGAFKGQSQKWMLLRYKGTDADINIATDIPEFEAWQWMAPDELVSLAVPFKQQVYRALMQSFAPHLGR